MTSLGWSKRSTEEDLRQVILGFPQSIDEFDIEKKLTMMHFASMRGWIDTVSLLIERGSKSVNAPNCYGQLPISYAATHGYAEIVELLVRHGSRTDDPNNVGDTPMHCAARSGHPHVAETLARLGSMTICTLDKACVTPLYRAVLEGHVSTVKTLARLDNKAIWIQSSDGYLPVHRAASDGCLELVKFFVRIDRELLDVQTRDLETPLFIAASRGREDVVEFLVRMGSNSMDAPDIRGRTPVTVAAEYGKPWMIITLVRLGSKALDFPDKRIINIANTAIFGQQAECARILRSLLGNPSGMGLRELIDGHPFWVSECAKEEYTHEVRYRVYFGESLVGRLIFQLKRLACLRSEQRQLNE